MPRQGAGVRRVKAAKQSTARRRLRTPNPEMRARLMQAAAELIQERGYPLLRVEEIAGRAEVSVGTFYLYFEGKADLFVALVQALTEELRACMRAADDTTERPTQRLARRLNAYLDFVEENAAAFRYFRDGGTVDTNVGSLQTWALAVHADDLQPVLEAGMEAGEISPMNPALLAHAMVGTIQHLAGYWLEHRDTTTRDEIQHFIASYTTFGSRLPSGREEVRPSTSVRGRRPNRGTTTS